MYSLLFSYNFYKVLNKLIIFPTRIAPLLVVLDSLRRPTYSAKKYGIKTFILPFLELPNFTIIFFPFKVSYGRIIRINPRNKTLQSSIFTGQSFGEARRGMIAVCLGCIFPDIDVFYRGFKGVVTCALSNIATYQVYYLPKT